MSGEAGVRKGVAEEGGRTVGQGRRVGRVESIPLAIVASTDRTAKCWGLTPEKMSVVRKPLRPIALQPSRKFGRAAHAHDLLRMNRIWTVDNPKPLWCHIRQVLHNNRQVRCHQAVPTREPEPATAGRGFHAAPPPSTCTWRRRPRPIACRLRTEAGGGQRVGSGGMKGIAGSMVS